MLSVPAMALEVRLSDPSLDFWVDVRLRSFGERWLAVADIGGEAEVAIGPSARQALSASLAPLGDRVRTKLLADPALLGTSAELARASHTPLRQA